MEKKSKTQREKAKIDRRQDAHKKQEGIIKRIGGGSG